MSEDIRHQMVALLPRMRSFARSLARNHADADDLVQQTCEKALSAMEQFVPGTRLDSWLYRIMHNHWIDTVRRARPSVDITDEAVSGHLVGEDGRKTTDARMELSAVEAAVHDLPEEQRSVLVLVCVEGLRYREAADILGVPVGTVMSRLARARTTIAAVLETGTAARAMGDEK